MCRSLIASFALIALSIAPSGAQETPELALVQATEALVRSGPGEAFYPTGRLEIGQRVEIYRRKQDGWCAIRPPEGSFSYVRADHVRPTETATVLEVTRDGTKTRVGSALKQAYQVEYVSLKLGERLKMLGRPVRMGTSQHAWYRVAPPAGEFRWVRARDLQNSDNAQTSTASSTSVSSDRSIPVNSISTSPKRDSPSSAPADDAQGLAFEKLNSSSGQMTTEPIQSAALSTDAPAIRTAHADRSSLAGTGNERSTISVDGTPESSIGGARRSQSTEALPFVSDPDLRLSELELALSRMVTLDIDQWNLTPLRQEIDMLRNSTLDGNGQRAAQQLIERIDEFAVLQRRYRDLATPSADERAATVSLTSALAPRDSSNGLAPSLANLPPDPPNQFLARQAAIRRQAEHVHYAGQGWLVPVLSSHTHLPRFAITDREGSIQAFVSPRPGLNLRRYLRQEVGIVGRETAAIDDAAPHLLAERIVVLDRHR